MEESLDCLQLNVYVPSEANVKNPLPVLVWIHGGFFRIGTSLEFGARHFTKRGVIVVTINYRLGAYGFMCLDNPAAPGNQGLKDQHKALQWVKDNIAAFGGNPYNVAIAGHNAGSASVLLHLYSPKEKLFSKVIAQSGTPLSPDMFSHGDSNAAIKLAKHLGLNATNDQQALDFLAKTHHGTVTDATHYLKIEFKPCKEKSFSGVDIFVNNDPYLLVNERKITNTPILIGNTDFEYRDNIQTFHGDDYFTEDFFYSRLQNTFSIDSYDLATTAEIVRHFYIGDKTISLDVNTEAEYFNSDFVFNHPIQDTITKIVNENANPVYEYIFSYVGNSGSSGASHSAELPYLFDGASGENRRHSSNADELLLIERLTTLWTNFVKYG